MGQDEKPTPIESVDPTFGMPEEEAAAAKQAARLRHPAFNPKVYEKLVKKALTSDAETDPVEITEKPTVNAFHVMNLSAHTTHIDGRKIMGAKISEKDGEKPL